VIAELTKDTYNDYYHIYEEKFADEGWQINPPMVE
jgi:hypothetical protein